MKRKWSFLAVLAVFFVPICSRAQTQPWSSVITSPRAIDWTQAGVSGGIPSGSWTQCGSTIAAYGSSASPASPATINNALAHTASGYTACGANTCVVLGAGTFYLSAGILTTTSNECLRGQGPSATHLEFYGGVSCWGSGTQSFICVQSTDTTYPSGSTSFVNWTANYSRGTTQITLDNVSSLVAGSLLFLEQCSTGYSGSTGSSTCTGTPTDNGGLFECDQVWNGTNGCAAEGPDGGLEIPNRAHQEVVQVTAVNTTTKVVTITPPIQYPDWSATQSPQAWIVQPVQYTGIEALSIDGSNSTGTPGGVGMFNAANAWVKNVAVENVYLWGVWAWDCFRYQVDSNYFYDIGLNGGSANDSFGVRYNGGYGLIQNNIVHNARVGYLAEGPSFGDVIAYNYAVFQNGESNYMWQAFRPHSLGAEYQLYEGNIGNTLYEEVHHGTTSLDTVFRNFFNGWQSCGNAASCGGNTSMDSGSTEALENEAFVRYVNDIGNVLGTPGYHTVYQDTAGFNDSAVEEISAGNPGATPGIPPDTYGFTTVMRWGNYDVVTGAVRWCGNSSDTAWSTTCGGTSEVPTGDPHFPNSVPSLGDSGAGQGALPASFYLSAPPSWWIHSVPWPAIGPDVTNGNIGQCTGTLNTAGEYAGLPAAKSSQCTGTSLGTAWGGHVNANPAMNCYLNILGGLPDGTGPVLNFDANTCYPPPPNGLTATLQ